MKLTAAQKAELTVAVRHAVAFTSRIYIGQIQLTDTFFPALLMNPDQRKSLAPTLQIIARWYNGAANVSASDCANLNVVQDAADLTQKAVEAA